MTTLDGINENVLLPFDPERMARIVPSLKRNNPGEPIRPAQSTIFPFPSSPHHCRADDHRRF